jgi:hypothetical protein
VLENYLTYETPFDLETLEGRIANSGKEHLPPPKTGTCEGSFFIPVNNVWGWLGKVDWLSDTGDRYIDHKTTSDFKWIKSVDILKKDPQGVLYGYRGIGDKQEQSGSWIYYRTKGAHIAKAVDFTITREQVADGVAELEKEANDLVSLRGLKFLDLPPNPDSCHAFGKPCPHQGMCTDLNGPSLLKGMLMATLTKDELLAKLRGSALAGAVQPVQDPVANPAPVVVNPQPAAPVATNTPAALLALIPGGAPPPAAAAPPPPPVVPVAAPTPGPVASLEPPPAAGANGPAEPVTQPGTPVAKRGPGRPPGSKNKSKDVVSSLPPSVDSSQSVPVQPGPVVEGIPNFGTLYVNCMPMHDEEYTVFPQVCGAGIVVDTRTFLGRDNLAELMQKCSGVVMPIP